MSFTFDPQAAAAMSTVAKAAPAVAASTPRTVASDDDEMPWEQEDWIPATKSGKQKSPNQIRNEFQKYLDTCGRTQAAVLSEIHVSAPSFRKFMVSPCTVRLFLFCCGVLFLRSLYCSHLFFFSSSQ